MQFLDVSCTGICVGRLLPIDKICQCQQLSHPIFWLTQVNSAGNQFYEKNIFCCLVSQIYLYISQIIIAIKPKTSTHTHQCNFLDQEEYNQHTLQVLLCTFYPHLVALQTPLVCVGSFLFLRHKGNTLGRGQDFQKCSYSMETKDSRDNQPCLIIQIQNTIVYFIKLTYM